MKRILRSVWLCLALLVVSAIACGAAVYPTVDFAFNPSTFEYAWTVNYPADATAYFTIFQVSSKLPSGSWTSFSGAWSGDPSTDEAWAFTSPPNPDTTVALRWIGGAAHQRIPGTGAWTGVFKIVVPNSEPIAGNVRTYASVTSYNTVASQVPNIVPEPSSLVALLSMVGIAPLVLRRRR